jgi:mannose-1-phosphate guanylyltransferase
MSVAVFLMAAGLGTRLKPLTDYLPKCLLPIFRKPVLQYWLELIEKTNIKDVYINTHWKPECVQDFIDEFHLYSPLKIRLLHEEQLLGSGGTLIKHHKLLNNYDKILIIYADNFIQGDISKFIDQCCNSKLNTIGVFETKSPENAGIFSRSEGCLNFDEKPKSPKSNTAWSGILAINKDSLLKYVATQNKGIRDIATSLIPTLLSSCELIEIQVELIDVGTFDGYSRALSCALKGAEN